MTRPIMIAMGVVIIAAGFFAIVLNNLALAILAIVLLLLLLATVAGPGRVVTRCGHLIGRGGTLQLWGVAPRALDSADIIIERVWALGAGLHFRVAIPHAALSAHIKVAQPRGWSISPDALTIEDAKYVQVGGEKVERAVGALALQLFLSPSPSSR